VRFKFPAERRAAVNAVQTGLLQRRSEGMNPVFPSVLIADFCTGLGLEIVFFSRGSSA
jgi:hypothetical protein